MRTLYIDDQFHIVGEAWDILIARELASYKPEAIVHITRDEEVLWLLEHGDPGKLLTTLAGREYYAVLPTQIEVEPWNARPVNRIGVPEWALINLGVERTKAHGLIKDGRWDNPGRGKYASVIEQAKEYLQELESTAPVTQVLETNKQLPLFYSREDDLSVDQLIVWAEHGTPVAFDIETTGLNPHTDDLVGISFSDTPGHAVYIDLQQGIPCILRAVLAHPAIPKVTHNGKFDYKFLTAKGVHVENLAHDTKVLAYLLQLPNTELKALGENELDYHVTHFNDIVPEGTTFDLVAEDTQTKYGCQDSDLTLRLYERLTARVRAEGRLWNIYEDIEMPLLPILAHMELAGAEVDVEEAQRMMDDLEQEVESLETAMWVLAGQEFDPNSAKDLQFLLYEKLGLQPIKETKSGLSTDKFTLEKLRDEHSLISLILEWRARTKLISTYLRPIIDAGSSRVHGSFNQCVTVTGRLSASRPNLQNQSPRARSIYRVPEGKLMVAADYSQQELRLLAHCSQDPKMLSAFRNGEDVHQQTSDLLGIPRKLAKNVNFGLAYGAGADAIARQAKCSKSEAQAVLDAHRSQYTQLWQWIEDTKTLAHQTGYAESIWGRRRYVTKIFSPWPEDIAAAEREAVNMVIQGSAADITKIAMNRVTRALEPWTGICRLILQVHDELVFELEEEDALEAVVPIIEQTMVGVDDGLLTVPMQVDAKWGHRWSELK